MIPRLSKAADLVGTYTSGSQDWHELRATGIGASDIATILGLSPWDSPFALWHRKNGIIVGKPANREMSWGHRHENTIAQWYKDTHPGVRVARTGTWRNRQRPWQLANPDRLLTGRRVLEIKTDRHGSAWGEPGTDEVPVYYRAQLLWQLDTLGWDTGILAVLIGLSDAREYVVHWNEDEVQIMRDAAEKFWTSLRTGARPPLDGHEATMRTMRELHPEVEDTEVEIPAALAASYLAAFRAEKDAAQHKRELACEVMAHMGNALRAVCEGRRIAIRLPGPHGAPASLRPAHSAIKNITTGQKIGAAA